MGCVKKEEFIFKSQIPQPCRQAWEKEGIDSSWPQDTHHSVLYFKG
jgi:hypothetical protein